MRDQNDNNFQDILDRYLAGTANEQEIAFLESRYIHWKTGRKHGYSESELAEMDELMWKNIESRVSLKDHRHIKKLWKGISIAAAVITVFTLAIGFYFIKSRKQEPGQVLAKTQDIGPGKQQATLTLSNGKKILLNNVSNLEMAQETGIKVTQNKKGQLVYEIEKSENRRNETHTLSTAKGESYQLRLPDGTMVNLNASSSLTYQVDLVEKGKRQVTLTGEGYFEVAKDKKHPFVVQTHGQQIEVLGTHFNVNAYQDEPAINTTLLEGSVKITNRKGNTVTLRPGNQARVTEAAITVSDVDTDLAIAWTNNEFTFEQESVENIMKEVARWYDVEIVYQGVRPSTTISGSISRLENVSKILDILESTGQVHFKTEGRKIYVLK